MKRYVVHPEALADYSKAAQHYAEQSKDVAQEFVNTIEATIYKIRENPDRYNILEDNVRRCLTYKFPYAILYEVQPDYIVVWAVMHCKRNPNYWKTRSSQDL